MQELSKNYNDLVKAEDGTWQIMGITLSPDCEYLLEKFPENEDKDAFNAIDAAKSKCSAPKLVKLYSRPTYAFLTIWLA